jgi:hypothetical protein
VDLLYRSQYPSRMGRSIDESFQATETGEQHAGWLIDAMTVTSTRWGDVDVAVIREDRTNLKFGVWLNRLSLQSQFEKLRPQLGSMIAVTYKGLQAFKSTGRNYTAYNVQVGESIPDTGRDWIEDLRDEIDKAAHRSDDVSDDT